MTLGGNANATSTFSGAITLNNNLTVAQVTTSGTNVLTLSGNIAAGTAGVKTLTFAGPGAIKVTGIVGNGTTGNGPVALSVTGGTTTLTANNTYSGGTTVNGGVVILQNTGAFGSGTVTLNGGRISSQVPGVGSGTVISGQFTNTSGGTALASTDQPGVVAGANWNVISTGGGNQGDAGGPTALHDSGGTSTPATVTWTSTNAWNNGAQTTAFGKLMSAFMCSVVTLTFNNIPYSSYSVYIYTQNNHLSEFSITDTHTTYYGESDNTLMTTPVAITNTTAGTYPNGNYLLFTGETTSSLTISTTNIATQGCGVCGFQIVQTVYPTIYYANNFAVNGNATLDLTAASAATIGSLTVNNATLSVTGSSTGSNTAYALNTGTVTLTGNAAISVANNGNATATLNLGALNDGGTAGSLTTLGNGTITLGSAANTMNANNAVTVSGTTTLNSGNATALGNLANVTVGAGATLNINASQTFGAPGRQRQRYPWGQRLDHRQRQQQPERQFRGRYQRHRQRDQSRQRHGDSLRQQYVHRQHDH